ncbi:MAG: preprotein translocase subunit SecE [Lentimicrobiaceae bacterium]|jgi:preprotein translocase subunit SecE|nr:preprotein translocase subunit SecE [Lentimicrobiaceae bacterium]MDG1900660.1 preprotein translocase subunit SecE [Bacteroidales bacterium]MBT3455116.1 preprotein translocase subunit SecE [Lentimicrobiaceae bacterium]MBT3818705.1 preprotein translocase subunit SecE [Lentimicrobiaceae bacterium]MBT4062287.1 preprotein translocase subunit SecE [Lentimicrobiaceae bacterium]|tara:strand:+ start:365 stop:562 length:198 start_codon:yes stop_codon:yes gene_type:complete
MAKLGIINYFKVVYDEWMHKVSWPSWSELQNSAIVVSVASLIIAIIVYMMDITFSSILERFYGLF